MFLSFPNDFTPYRFSGHVFSELSIFFHFHVYIIQPVPSEKGETCLYIYGIFILKIISKYLPVG